MWNLKNRTLSGLHHPSSQNRLKLLERDNLDLYGAVNDAFSFVNDYVWYIAFVFLIGLGIYFTARLKVLQLVRVKECAKLALTGVKEGKSQHTVSSFEAFCIGLGARVGVGNIVGVSSAILAGGPGAIFWMWIFAIIGAASSFMESTLAQIFKEKKGSEYYGGPAYYVLKGLKNRYLSMLLAFLIVITFGIGFVGVQASSAAGALTTAFEFEHNTLVFGIIIAVAAAIIIFGGMKRIAGFSTKVVPAMAIAWLILCLVILIRNYDSVPHAIKMIFTYAFDAKSITGGLIGAVIMNGLRRGVFSNEAGLGSVANIASTADVKHPVKQGMIQSFGTLVDTLVVCSFSALAILSTYGTYEGLLDTGLGKTGVMPNVFELNIGDLGPMIVSIFLLVFAFTSLLGYYSMSESNIRFISDKKSTVFAVRVLVIVVAFIAVIAGADLMELVCDTFMAAMGAVNMLCVFLLSKFAFRAYEDWKQQKEAGIEEPVFCRDVLDDPSGVTEWGPQEQTPVSE